MRHSAAVVGLVVLCGCSSDPEPTPAATSRENGAVNDAGASNATNPANPSTNPTDSGTTTTLSFTGGSSPFACTTTGVDAWPVPGPPAFEAFRALFGFDVLQANRVTDASAPALYVDDAGEYGGPMNQPRYVIAYQKDSVNHAIRSVDELRTLTPVIDGPAKAYFWAEANGWRVECKTDWYRTAGDAIELSVSRLKVVCEPRETAIIRIARDGTITVVETGTGSAACL